MRPGMPLGRKHFRRSRDAPKKRKGLFGRPLSKSFFYISHSRRIGQHTFDDRGACVLRDVGDRLRRDVIGGRLNAFREPRAEIQFEFNRHRGPAGQRFERWREPGFGRSPPSPP